jgi:HTH-type transcriptional regulator / antitoxin HigA
MTQRVPAEVFPPGEFIRDELEARNWTQADLAAILKRPLPAINEIIKGKKAVTAETAKALGDAFGTGPEYWQNLQAAYDRAMSGPVDEDVARLSAIYAAAPINEMVKRRWIDWSNDADTLEKSVLNFYGAESINNIAALTVAARKSSSYEEMTPLEVVWCHRARQLAESVSVTKFNADTATFALADLHKLTSSEQEVRRIPKFLAEIGIRLVIVERLPKTLIDGAAFWLEGKHPVIALSLRSDRIDNFWFTLCHELAHILRHDEPPIDTKLVGKDRQPSNEKSEIEQAADKFASEILVAPDEIESFIMRVKPLYSKTRINQFAGRLGIHPGIIVGQLQYRREIGYFHSREMLVEIKDLITPSAMTDGWGSTPF